ncbi:MAG: aspartate-semialdehyde dehydrogenase [Myxococcota bacterium]|jgi:aspartate-semialdehyde dehydrogenase
MPSTLAIMNAQSVLSRDIIDTLGDLEDTDWIGELRLFGEPDDSFIRFRGSDHYIQAWSEAGFRGVGVALCAGAREVDGGAVAVGVASTPDPEIPVVLCELNAADVDEHRGTVHVPTGAAAAVALIARALRPVSRITGTLLQPASSLGPKAMEELYGQTVALLNHRPLVTTAIGDRLAFNVLPARTGLAGLEALLDTPTSVSGLLVPVFGGTTLSLALETTSDNADVVRKALEASPRITVSDDVQPASAVGIEDVRVQVLDCGNGLVQLVAVVDEVRRESVSMLDVAREIITRNAF